MDLRVKIAIEVGDGVISPRGLQRADAILAIPEIKEAQDRIKELEREIDLMDGDMRETGYFD